MTAPIGVRLCPVMGCSRRVHISPSGIVYARCLMHTLRVLSGAFSADPPTPRDAPNTSVSRNGLTSTHRERPDAALTASPGR